MGPGKGGREVMHSAPGAGGREGGRACLSFSQTGLLWDLTGRLAADNRGLFVPVRPEKSMEGQVSMYRYISIYTYVKCIDISI